MWWNARLLGCVSYYMTWDMMCREQSHLFCDNMSSIQLTNNPIFHARTKHIEVHYHYVHEKVLVGDIDLLYVSTQEQVVDIFTKSLGVEKLQSFRSTMRI